MSCWNPAKGRAIRRSSLWFVGHGNERPGAARRLVTFLARPRKVTKGRPPRCRALYSQGHPALPDSTRRLRNSTWRGTQNVPHCGTDSVPGGRKLGAEPESWAPVSATSIRVSAPVPANGAALNESQVHQCSSKTPCRVELLGAPQGEQTKRLYPKAERTNPLTASHAAQDGA